MQGIYSITNKVNGKRYIGLSRDIHKRLSYHKNRLTNCKHTNIKLQRAWNKYGEEAFELEVLVIVNEREKLGEIEVSLIKEYDSYKNGYNCSEGGERGGSYVMSQETRDKIANANIGRKHTEESKQKMSALRKGKPGIKHSDYTKKKISEIKKANPTRQPGESNGRAKLREYEVIDIKVRYLKGERVSDINKRYERISRSTVRDICANSKWKHIPNTLEELLELQKTA